MYSRGIDVSNRVFFAHIGRRLGGVMSSDLFHGLAVELTPGVQDAARRASGGFLSCSFADADRLIRALFANLRRGGFCTHLVTGNRPWDCRGDRFEAAREAARRGCRIERAFLICDRHLRHDVNLRDHLALDRAAGIGTRILHVGDILEELVELSPGSLEFGLWDDALCEMTLYAPGTAANGASEWRAGARAQDVRRALGVVNLLNEKACTVDIDDANGGAAEVEEPLILSAPMARRLAHDSCRKDPNSGQSCAWYHGPWQYLRLLGVITTLRTDGEYLVDVFRTLARDGNFRRILISGAADYSMLAHVLWAYRRENASAEISLVDWCETPLHLNRWYAEQFAATVDTFAADIFDYEAEAPFDLICTHSFIGRFDAAGRRRLTAKWRELLRPGGKVVTVKRIRPDHEAERVRFTPEQAAGFVERTRRSTRVWREFLDVDPEELVLGARTYTERHGNYTIRSRGEIRDLFESAGFAVEHLESGGPEEQRRDRPSVASEPGKSERIRILATRVG